MDLSFLIKKTMTLTALVDPFLAAPLFMAATAQLGLKDRVKFARALAATVGIGLLVGGLLGMHILSVMGVSLAAMQLAGGVIAFAVAMAMVVAKEQAIKLNGQEANAAAHQTSIVPLGIPLLVGPASLSYVMATSTISSASDIVHIAVAPVVVAALTWVVLEFVAKTDRFLSAATLNVMERVGGFLLAALAVEMMAGGVKGLFPTLAS